MRNFIKEKIRTSKVSRYPFPYLVIKNFIPKKDLNSLKKKFPDFDDLDFNDVLIPSKSCTKKSILPQSKLYKILLKTKPFNRLNKSLRSLEPQIKKKFSKYINIYVDKKYQKEKLKFHMAIASMRKGYIKSPHTDRRDHLIHCLFYIQSEANKGGDLNLLELKKKQKIYDVFPDKNILRKYRKFSIKSNFCILTLNLPWAYQSVSRYFGFKDRKFIYAVYDFKTKKPGTYIKNRKNGFNLNDFWKDKVRVKSSSRKKIFLSE
jgi:hypothetical protein